MNNKDSMESSDSIGLICPICNNEVKENDEVQLGTKQKVTNVTEIDVEKVKLHLFHTKCIENDNSKEE